MLRFLFLTKSKSHRRSVDYSLEQQLEERLRNHLSKDIALYEQVKVNDGFVRKLQGDDFKILS